MNLSDLRVYNKLCELSHEVYKMTLVFPKFEMYELGSQLRRSSNSAPANLAECFGNKHTKIYLEGISRAKGEIRETEHHLNAAKRRGYSGKNTIERYITEYSVCGRMLTRLEYSLTQNKPANQQPPTNN